MNTTCIATTRDALSIACIQQTSSAAAYAPYLSDPYLTVTAIEKRLRVWQETIGTQRNDVFLSLCDGAPVGYIHCRSDYPDLHNAGEISSIYILPGYMRSGRGKQLLERGHEALQKANRTTAGLWVLGCNQATIAFYHAMGYAESGRTKPYRFGLNVIEMQCQLTNYSSGRADARHST
jgi:ribosomal protein S18 acetylase RimI-like enzyme